MSILVYPPVEQPIDLKKLSAGFERFSKQEKLNFMCTHLACINPMPNLELISSNIFKDPFHKVIAFLSYIMGLDHDQQIDEVALAMLMFLFSTNNKSSIMLCFDEFIATCIKEHLITMIPIKCFHYQGYLVFMFLKVHINEFKHLSLHQLALNHAPKSYR